MSRFAKTIFDISFNNSSFSEVSSNRIKSTLEEAIEEVSDFSGEGALIIVGKDELIQKYIRDMDTDKSKMRWRSGKPLIFLDKTLLRALLIMDGATWFNVSTDIFSTVIPRWVIYPYCTECNPPHAFSVLDKQLWSDDCILHSNMPPPIDEDIKQNKEFLNGKGSKHHGAANLSLLLYLLNGCNDDNFRIFTISADGPITEWPNKLTERK